MNVLEWNAEQRTVSWSGETVALLPKEYALLAFLHRNAGTVLSREQLLDGVWPGEYPTDRTVDDHIYRLRRKFAPWSAVMDIDTVRGLGYRLSLKPPAVSGENPLLKNGRFLKDMQGIADMYIRYGRGDALLTLARNADMFGFDLQPHQRMLLRCMEGDIPALLDEGTAPFAERAFFLLLLHQYLDPAGNRPYVEQAIASECLSPLWHIELTQMLMPSLYMDWDDDERAAAELDLLDERVRRLNWTGIVPLAANLRLELALLTGSPETEALLKQATEKLEQYPYARERGKLRMLEGLWAEETGRRLEAGRLIDEGLDRLGETKFLPHVFGGYMTLLHTAERRGHGRLRKLYLPRAERLHKAYGLNEAKAEMERQLKARLG